METQTTKEPLLKADLQKVSQNIEAWVKENQTLPELPLKDMVNQELENISYDDWDYEIDRDEKWLVINIYHKSSYVSLSFDIE